MDCEEDKPGHKCRKHLFTLCVRLFRPHDSKSSVHKKVFYIYTEITLLFSQFLFILFLSLTKTIVKLLQVGDIFHPGSSELLIYLLYKLMSFFFFFTPPAQRGRQRRRDCAKINCCGRAIYLG